MKEMKNPTNKTCREARQSSKMLRAILSIIILAAFLPVISGFEFDNVMAFDSSGKDYGKATITNMFGFGSTLAEIELLENSDTCSTDCFALGRTKLYTRSKLIDGLTFEYGNIKSYEIYIQTGVFQKEMIDYGRELRGDGRYYQIVTGSHYEEFPVWKLYDGKTLDVGEYYWKIEGKKNWYDSVDWIGEWMGVEVREWALWFGASGAVAYFPLDNLTGNATDRVGTILDGNISGSVIRGLPGIINNSMNFSDAPSGGGRINLHNAAVLNFTSEFTISIWFNRSADGSDHIVEKAVKYRFGFNGGGSLVGIITESDGTSVGPVILPIGKDVWTHAVFMANGTDIVLYVNGTEVDKIAYDGTVLNSTDEVLLGNGFLGKVDEIGFWDRGLSADEVSDLWNGGAGLGFGFGEESLVVSLVSPSNAITTVENSLFFNASLAPTNINLTNATINVWDSSDILVNSTTNLITGNITNYTTWNVTDLAFDDYQWNVFGCGVNGSGTTVCAFADSNRTFTIREFSIVSNTYSNNTFETDSESFEINFSTIGSIVSVDSNLIYNGTSHSATTTCGSGLCSSSVTIDLPLVLETGVETHEKSFFWNITLFDGSVSRSASSDTETQAVNKTHLEICNSTYPVQALNFTVYDEGDSSKIEPFYFAGDFGFWLGSGSVMRNNSFLNTTNDETNLCIFPPDRDFETTAIIEYNDIINSTTYNTRNYFFQQDMISNSSQNIPLFLLNVDDSTSFILKVQDTNLLSVENALIIIQRFNPGTGNFTTVSITKTDGNGQTVGFFKTETVDYRFIIVKNGVTLLTTVAGKVIPEVAPFTLIFTVGVDEGAPWDIYEDLSNLTSSLLFNASSGNITFSYIDSSGEFSFGRLILKRDNPSNVSTTICDVNSTLSTISLVCGTGNVTGTYTASGFIVRGSETFLVQQIIIKVETFSSVAGLLGVFLAWFIILLSAFAFKFNEIAGIVLMNLTVIMVNIIGLVNFGDLFIFGMMALSIFIMVLLKK